LLWIDHVKKSPAHCGLDDAIVTFLSAGQLTDQADGYPVADWLSYINEKSAFPSKARGHEPWKIFNEALKLGRDSVTNRLIDLGIHRIPDPNGYHVPLVDAVLYSATVNIETVQKLLLSGVDVHQVRHGDQTALSVAVEKENRQLISLLLKHGADIHHIPDDGEVEGSALACAVRYSSLDLLKFLLKEESMSIEKLTTSELLFRSRSPSRELMLSNCFLHTMLMFVLGMDDTALSCTSPRAIAVTVRTWCGYFLVVELTRLSTSLTTMERLHYIKPSPFNPIQESLISYSKGA
jgi:hypothetical protein